LSPLPDIWPIPGKCAAHFAKLKISEALSAAYMARGFSYSICNFTSIYIPCKIHIISCSYFNDP